jgi:hypothetical protein
MPTVELLTSRSVFVNCPFNDHYRAKLFPAILFSILDCGFAPVCALDRDNSSDSRLEKILELLSQCQLSVHDLSQVELDPAHGLPHFNMAFELGLFFGNRAREPRRSCLILDSDAWRYRAYLSDLSGRDIKAHSNRPDLLIQHIRNYLNVSPIPLPGPSRIHDRYQKVLVDLPRSAERAQLDPGNLSYQDLVFLIVGWQQGLPMNPSGL